ncbi:hypothetical protein BD324DRAFT_642094 [Kockovaella imperatae]|uniref:Phytanoyl-CoA dioxygenase n=1 Tax=Kockovaella imperatae TaxID=4999 RepID=A0A1Y1UHS2_9TREE|nr:hypothetical protein BD324DRAFT_642094 [Kockovaella imperatae]ORX37087.1 hypothetical protein BD324DRAFT_642094 [Kockovaella imperatae]
MNTNSSTETTISPAGVLLLRGSATTPETSYYEDLDKNGWCVVKNVISPEKAAYYVDQAYSWLEGFGKGFDKNDRETWKPENLPAFAKGGLFNRHASGHEQFAWDIRAEPGLIDVFAKIWGTDELAVSFDGVNVSLPFKADAPVDRKPWAHVDQSPLRRFKYCVQGIMNLAPNGPKDGGLMVLQGSFSRYNEFWEAHDHEAPPGGWSKRNGYHHTQAQLQWFYDRGCTWHKVEAGPGDVILWDSRCVHYGAAAEGDQPRVATYVCYKPNRDVAPDKQAIRKEAMENFDNTTHDAADVKQTGSRIAGKLSDDERTVPSKPPVLSHRAQQLAGIAAY